MTISKIYIGAFGGLKDYTLELSNGLNVIFGENENGKSTVMAFLKMMFYGGKSGKNLAKSPRQKYLPWDSSSMGGRIYFEHQGTNYCLEREFKRSDSTDRIILRNLDLGTSENVGSDIGKRFFGISEAAFERSVFIGSNTPLETDDSASGELNAKLSNIAVTGDESTSYRLVQKRIEDAVGELMTQRHVGIYDKGIIRLEELKNEFTRADAAAKLRAELSEKVKVLKARLSDTKKEYLKVKETVDAENDLKNAEKLREYLAAKKELDEINETLLLHDGSLLDSVFISKVNFCISKYEGEVNRIKERQEEIDILERRLNESKELQNTATPQSLEEAQAKLQTLNEKKEAVYNQREQGEINVAEATEKLSAAEGKKKALNPLLLVCGIIGLLVGVYGFVLTNYIVGAAAIVGIILVCLAFVLRPLDKSAITGAKLNLSNEQSLLSQLRSKEVLIQGEINSLSTEISLLAAALHTDKALLEQKTNELLEKKELLEGLCVQKDETLKELLDLFARYSNCKTLEEIKEKLNDISEMVSKQKEIKLRLKYLSSDLGNITYEEAKQKLDNQGSTEQKDNIDFDNLKSKLDELNEQGLQISSELSSLLTELKAELKVAVSPDVIESQIAELENKLDSQKKYCDSAKIALEVLEDSFAEVRREFGSDLEKRTLEIFSSLTNERYDAVNISSSLEIEAESKGEFSSRSIEYLSSGTVDQAYLSLRIAVLELMSGEERLPLLLDDALSQYDDRRTKTALQFLKEYAENTQVVLFTCHGAISDAATQIGAITKNLK